MNIDLAQTHVSDMNLFRDSLPNGVFGITYVRCSEVRMLYTDDIVAPSLKPQVIPGFQI